MGHYQTKVSKPERRTMRNLFWMGALIPFIIVFLCPSRKPISSITIDNAIAMEDRPSSKPQVCNPPMVHCLAWSPNGESFAAGLGNGSIGLFVVENRKLVQTGVLGNDSDTDGHHSSVASVVYPQFSSTTANRVLCSAGSDGSILFWDLGSMFFTNWNDDDGESSTKTNNKMVDDITELFGPTLILRDEEKSRMKSNKNSSQLQDPPKILFGIPHGQKMNWVTPAGANTITTTTNDGHQPSSSSNNNNIIFVADTSSDITMYTIPLQ
jgi:WD40 repeat protein